MDNRDHKTAWGCFSPQDHQQLAPIMALGYVQVRILVKYDASSKDEKRRAEAKQYAPLIAVLDKHGLTEKAAEDVCRDKTQKEAVKALAALIKNPEAFLVETGVAMDKIDGTEKDDRWKKSKLTEVKIEGDKATGVVTDGVDKEDDKLTFSFVKVGGSWRITFLPLKELPEGGEEDKERKRRK
jgi:hypothetical protein